MQHSIYKPLALFTLLLLIGCSRTSQADALPEISDFRIEAHESAQKKIPILVLFMSMSCHYCEIVLDDFLLPMYNDPELKNKVILRQIESGSHDKLIDFDGKATSQNAFSSKMKVGGVPHVMLFDSHGRKLGEIRGLLTVDYYNAYLEGAIQDATDKIRTGSK